MNCPNPVQLQAFLGREGNDEWDAHVEGCESCRAAIASLRLEDTGVQRQARQAAGEQPFTAEECRRAVAAVAALGSDPARLAPPGAKSAQDKATVVMPAPPQTVFGNFVLLRRIGGDSGQGEVYEALQVSLNRRVALKILRPERRGKDAIARFRRESQALAQLSHPNIVSAIDGGEANGVDYLVMDLLEGLSFDQLIQRHQRLPIAEACELIRQAAVGLQRVWAKKLVHRDLKPANLFLTTVGQVRILDLGLALGLDEDKLTPTGDIMGSVNYVAPEQIKVAHTVDTRADLYSLGCTLYQLLAGDVPFSRKKYPEKFQRLQAHLNVPAPPIRQHRSEVQQPLAEIVKRLLAKDAGARFAEPAELAVALKPFASGPDSLLALLGVQGLAVATASPDPTTTFACGQAAPAPLDAALELVFWDASRKCRLGLDDPGVLPVKEGDEFRIEVRLSRSAFVYLIWIDSQGNARPVHPWAPGSEWKLTGKEESRTKLTLPAGDEGHVLPINGPAGVETLVLLARDDEPLSADEHERFSGWLPARFPRLQSLPDPAQPRWLRCRREECEAAGAGVRGIGMPRAPADPLFQLDTLLRDRLGPRFRLVQAVSFMNDGAKGDKA